MHVYGGSEVSVLPKGRVRKYPYDIEIGESVILTDDMPASVSFRMNQTMRRSGDPRRYAQRGRYLWRIEDEGPDTRTEQRTIRDLAIGEYLDMPGSQIDGRTHNRIRQHARVSGKDFTTKPLPGGRGMRIERTA